MVKEHTNPSGHVNWTPHSRKHHNMVSVLLIRNMYIIYLMLAVTSCIINKDMAWPSWELRKTDNFVSSPSLSFSFTKLDFQNILYGLLHDSPLGSFILNRDRANGHTTGNDKTLYHSKTNLWCVQHSPVTVLGSVSRIQTQHVDNSSNLVRAADSHIEQQTFCFLCLMF